MVWVTLAAVGGGIGFGAYSLWQAAGEMKADGRYEHESAWRQRADAAYYSFFGVAAVGGIFALCVLCLRKKIVVATKVIQEASKAVAALPTAPTSLPTARDSQAGEVVEGSIVVPTLEAAMKANADPSLHFPTFMAQEFRHKKLVQHERSPGQPGSGTRLAFLVSCNAACESGADGFVMWSEEWGRRNAYDVELLCLGYDVLISDLDIVWLKPRWEPWMTYRHEATHPPYREAALMAMADVLVSTDELDEAYDGVGTWERWPFGVGWGRRAELNTGVLFFRATNGSKAFIQVACLPP